MAANLTHETGIDMIQNSDDPVLPEYGDPSPKARTRMKRSYDDFIVPSSDPPLFSSDGLDPSLDNYTTPRRKRQHVGAWYDDIHDDTEESFQVISSTVRTRARERGPFRRNFDSGICLPSDDSTESMTDQKTDPKDDESLLPTPDGGQEQDPNQAVFEGGSESSEKPHQSLYQLAMSTWAGEDPMAKDGPLFPYWQEQPQDLQQFHEVEATAEEKITLCVEDGHETVDLS